MLQKKSAIKEWGFTERPREKMLLFGADALTNAELLAIFIGSGTPRESAVGLAQRILDHYNGNLNLLSRVPTHELYHFNGIGPAKATILKAVFELQRRKGLPVQEDYSLFVLNGSEDCVRLFREYHNGRSDSTSWFLLANSNRRFLGLIEFASYVNGPDIPNLGDLLDTIQDHCASKLVFIRKVNRRATIPTISDIEFYEQLHVTSQQLGLDLMDFLMVSETSHCSFADLNLVPSLPYR
ncbi:UPF0758 domain-containing protein [Flagellimonas sp. SN16]|uniref:UPF0758 domain-containing protein n=1 Tax=Flagellimonas sp. SN16 TaxID=3415142 RepID=UPI003C4E42D9